MFLNELEKGGPELVKPSRLVYPPRFPADVVEVLDFVVVNAGDETIDDVVGHEYSRAIVLEDTSPEPLQNLLLTPI